MIGAVAPPLFATVSGGLIVVGFAIFLRLVFGR
jgi:hypothetical protein